MENLDRLVNELCKYPNETPWIEFKHNNYDPYMIGRDISALANSAALAEKNCSYMLWGIDDVTHEIVGTNRTLQTLKKGSEELENWLRSLLSPNADFEFHTVQMNNVSVGILIIYKASNQTVMFEKIDYVRIGSYTKKLHDYPALQAQLWDKIRNSRFEERYAKPDLTLTEAITLLNCQAYFDLKSIPIPSDNYGIAHYMEQEGIIIKQDNGLYSITNLGAILFAKQLKSFPRLERKSVRIVQYEAKNRFYLQREEVSDVGYAADFNNLIKYINALIPTREVIINGLRKKETAYPSIAIREAVANALVHQDFSVSGAGPTIEIFPERIEITNPGIPLVDIQRIIDNPPKSRNENLASIMRQLNICEELGTGWDKIIIACELMQLPAPKIELFEGSTRVTIFAEKIFSNLTMDEKLWSCYLHSCIMQVQGEYLTNKSLRNRFGLKESASASISRLIKEAVEKKLIKPLDSNTAPRYMRYLPYWA